MKNTTSDRDMTLAIISDMEKEVYGIRLRRDLSALSQEELNTELERLCNYAEEERDYWKEEEAYQKSCGKSVYEMIYGDE